MPWLSHIPRPGTKCEIAGLQPNTLYHFKLRFTSCRSHSSLSYPLLLMTAPAAPLLPPIVTSPVGMNTVTPLNPRPNLCYNPDYKPNRVPWA